MAHTELRPQKRQRVVSPGSASGDEVPPAGPSEDCSDQERENIEELSKTFDRFEGVLCELLSAASVVGDAKEALGEHKGSFVIALKRMAEAGDLPWVYQIDSGVEGSGNEVEAGESEVASSSQMDIDEMEIVSTNQPGGEEAGVVSASQVKTKEGGVSPASQAGIGEAEVGEAEVGGGEIASANEMEIDEIETVSVSQIRPLVEVKKNTFNHENVSLKEPLSIPTPTRNSQEIWPPPLPYIQNEALRRQALTPDTPQNSHDPAAHYQRLEWLGDAYMEVLVSRILFDRFPTAREGPLTRMRQPLLTNKLFSNFGTMYDFGAMIGEYSAHAKARETVPSLKVLADCFEAYVAAIALSDPDKGLDTLMQWLSPLYEPMFSEVGNGSQFKDEYSYGSKMEFLVPSRALMRRGGFKKTNPPKIVSQAPKQGKGKRRQSHKAAHRSSLPPPGSRKIGRRLIQYETGPPIIIEDSGDEDEENWEEVEIAGKANQNSAGIPIDMAAKEKLYALVAGDNVSVKYVCVGDPDSSGGVDAMQGIENSQNEWKVMVNFTGWGCVNRPIGCGWGANEAEAGIRAAMNIMRDRPFCKELDLRKFNKSRQVASPKKQKAPVAPVAPVAPTALMTSTIPGMWKEIDGVVVIDDD